MSLWRKTDGAIGEGLAADSNNDNVINGNDYTIWRELFGNDRHDGHHHHASGAGLPANIPEPASIVLIAIALVAHLRTR
jgi:hypothetical protein